MNFSTTIGAIASAMGLMAVGAFGHSMYIEQDQTASIRDAFAQMADADGDGAVSIAERKAVRTSQKSQRRSENRGRLLAQYDADGDGKLSADEKMTARNAGEKLRSKHGQHKQNSDEGDCEKKGGPKALEEPA